jgi:hypothetical protein
VTIEEDGFHAGLLAIGKGMGLGTHGWDRGVMVAARGLQRKAAAEQASTAR